jgi:RNA polymerase sigma factor (sigma-70 family)
LLNDDQKRQMMVRLREVLVQMSWMERHCFVLHTVEKLSFSEIGKVMNVSKSSVQTYIERARKKIKKYNHA